MRKYLLIAMVLLMMFAMASVASAENIRTTTGAMLDAPNLIRLTENITIGVEGGKDIYINPFQDSARFIDDDKGFFGYLKITYTGTWFNFAKK